LISHRDLRSRTVAVAGFDAAMIGQIDAGSAAMFWLAGSSDTAQTSSEAFPDFTFRARGR